eukprot:UN34830
MLPQILEKYQTITIPPQKGSGYTLDAMTITDVSIDGVSVAFKKNINSIIATLQNISLEIPHTNFRAEKKVLFSKIKCNGHIWGKFVHTNVNLQVNQKANR